MFRSVECAKNLTWHATEREIDDKLRHPADSPAWKLVDTMWPNFSSEPRNLRLALSANGINPYSDMSSKYSCWPVVMVIYNLPLWLCMKRKFMTLSILISGSKQLGDDIGIYLEPLIDDLKLLWKSGVQCYDAYNEELFNLRTVLLWTINDFPAYGNLSGCSVKGYKACTLLDIPGKTKDGLNARRDLADLKIRPELTPINGEKNFIPPACYTLTKKEKRFLLKSLSEMKVLREFLCGVDPIGLGCQKLRDNSDYSELGRPLSSGVTSIPERELLYQAHRYVLENTVDVQPYIEKHLIALQQQHRSRSKNQKWIQDEHNQSFISWLREKFETELATGDVEVSDNLRWIAHGPHPVVTNYNSYAINGCHYHTKLHDKNKTVQNSGVSLVAKTMQESPNDALTQALGTPEYGGRVRGVGGFITPTVYFHQAKPRKSKKVDATQQIIDENEALHKRIRELEQKVQSIPTSKHGSCSKSKVQKKEKVLENVVKEKKGIATSVPPVSLTSKKKVVEEEEVKEEEVIATTPMTKNEVKSSRPITKEVEVTSEPSNLPIQLKYILRYAETIMVDGSSFSFQLPLELFGISRKSYVLREDVIDFCNMQKVKTLSMVAYITYLYSLIIDLKKVSKYVFVDPSLISAGHSTREIRARNLCSRLMTSKQDQLVVAPYNPGDHWSLVIINPYDDLVYHLDSLRTSSRDDIKYVTNMALTIFQSQKNLKKTRKTTFWKAVKCPLQVGTVECGYYVMRYMREILSKDTSIITDAIDTRNSYSQLELDEVRVEWAEFLSWYI
ncbi:hypothetical protein E6C27_scaffold284G00640 [Cucumis melo var. makuwa]|uniref:Ubiquitin-like protease family profile domain-containing protein n=1 Tax=Cucumis melo var. makuwa TaxID=1194695 RepID=A0A5A7TSY7_CUCMM|nr:hypothetical protein E6C27_scaffold284G00640 [Cucumis melo var. makuwa]